MTIWQGNEVVGLGPFLHSTLYCYRKSLNSGRGHNNELGHNSGRGTGAT